MFAPTNPMLSYEQTVLVYRPDTHIELQTIADRPIPPPEYFDEVMQAITEGPEPFTIYDEHTGVTTSWWKDGLIKVDQADDVQLYFWPKPTLVDAMEYRHWRHETPENPGFFHFKGDGTVYASSFGVNAYWGPTKVGCRPIRGQRVEAQKVEPGAWGVRIGGSSSGGRR